MRVGSNHCGPQQSTHAKGGSGEKVKGGSGEKSKGGSGEKCNPGHGGMPPGLAKKMQDGFEHMGDRIRENIAERFQNQDGDHQGFWDTKSGGGLGGLIGGFLSNIFGGWGGHNDGVLGASQNSTPIAVAEGQKNQTTNPVVDLGNQAVSGSAKPLPFISQYNPDGADANYKNGAENCGPALLASIAKANGLQPAGMTDAQLITKQMGLAGTTGEGTTGNGMIAALEDMGMKTAASPRADMNWINSQLALGHEVIANGDFYSVPGHTDPKLLAGHYVAVTSVANGLYAVTDPADASVTSMTADQLATFINNHPQGGFTISAWT